MEDPTQPDIVAAAPPEFSMQQFNLQDYLSLGYLYLLFVGIVSDSVYYHFFEIAILSYSSVLDVLLSPLTYLEKEPTLFVTIMFVVVAASLTIWWQRRRHARLSTESWYREKLGVERLARTQRQLDTVQFVVPMIVVFASYLGYAAGAGRALSADMKEGSLRMSHVVTIADGQRDTVRVIGSNTQFVFYVSDGERIPIIAPLGDGIRALQQLPKQ